MEGVQGHVALSCNLGQLRLGHALQRLGLPLSPRQAASVSISVLRGHKSCRAKWVSGARSTLASIALT
jgi:hypothetical protein